MVKEKRHLNVYYSNDSTKQRMGPRVNEFFNCEVEKRSRTVECQAGSGRISKKMLLKETKKKPSASDSDTSDKEN